MADQEKCQACGEEDHGVDRCPGVGLRGRPRKGARERGRGIPHGPGPAGWAYRLLLDAAEKDKLDSR